MIVFTPIAMVVVEVESLVTWKWFLQTLVNDLGIDNTSPWTIMTNKEKVIILIDSPDRLGVDREGIHYV
jgi:hypothetical protein